jgi:hypothetical protein
MGRRVNALAATLPAGSSQPLKCGAAHRDHRGAPTFSSARYYAIGNVTDGILAASGATAVPVQSPQIPTNQHIRGTVTRA